MTNQQISDLTGIDIDGLIRTAETGADWAKIARVEADAVREKARRVGCCSGPHYEVGVGFY